MQIEEDKFTHAIARGEKQIGLWISLCLSMPLPIGRGQPTKAGLL